MAKVNLQIPFESFSGTLKPKGIIYRRKQYRDDNGRVVHEGTQEAYAVKRPRNYKKNPPQGAEQESINRFREASIRAKAIMRAGTADNPEAPTAAAQSRTLDTPTQSELKFLYVFYLASAAAQSSTLAAPAQPVTSSPQESAATAQSELKSLYDSYLARYNAQLHGKPDPLAPIDRTTHRPKHYYRLDNFIRAMLIQEMKATTKEMKAAVQENTTQSDKNP